MRTASDPDGTLVIRSSPILFLGVGLAMLAVAACLALDRAPEPRQWIAAVGLIVLGAIMTLVAERSEFRFDVFAREVRWRRATLLRARGGTIPFDRITGVRVQSTPGSRGTRLYRLALVAGDEVVPITSAYTNVDGGRTRAIEAIQGILGSARAVPVHR